MMKPLNRKIPERKKPQQIRVRFPFRPINSSKMHIKTFKHSTGQYKRFTKKCFKVLEEHGYRRGCIALRGDLTLSMEFAISDRRAYAHKYIAGVLGTLVQFFGKWHISQIHDVQMRKIYVETKEEEYFTISLRRS